MPYVLPWYNEPSIIIYFADLCRLITLIILLTAIRRAKHNNGLSGKTQLLYAAIYFLRTVCSFADFLLEIGITSQLFYHEWQFYPRGAICDLQNAACNATFTFISCFIIYSIYVSFKKTYSKQEDSFRTWRLVYLCIPPALLVNHRGWDAFTVDIIWTYTVYLEALAMMPQLYLPSATLTPTVRIFVASTLFHRFLYICHLLIWDIRDENRMYLAACIVEIMINLEILLARKKPDTVSVMQQAEGSALGSKDAEVGSNYDKVYSVNLTPAALIGDEKANLVENDEKSVK